MAKWNPQYKIDLREVFDGAYSGELNSKLRPILQDSNFKQLYATRVIDEIIKRTKSGIDRHGKSLGTYSGTYKGSLIFKIYKGGETKVNLTLTGEMLSSLVDKASKFNIIIELDGEENKAKAEGHITGKLGKFGRAKPRDFLGLPKTVERQIMKESISAIRNNSPLVAAELAF